MVSEVLASGRVVSVNVGLPRQFEHNGRSAESAIWKSPVSGRVRARAVNLEGDRQADPSVHGGLDKAVYVYAREDYGWWKAELDRPVADGTFGENLTTVGLDLTRTLIGERWEIGTTVLEVSEPRIPCWKLGVRMDDRLFPRRFTKAGRPGTYLRVVGEGDVGAGDEIRVVERPPHDLTVGDLFRIYSADRHEAGRLLAASQLSERWREWAEEQLGRTRR